MESMKPSVVEVLFQRVRKEATTCKTAEEAEDLFRNAPSGSEAENIYEARWMELHLKE